MKDVMKKDSLTNLWAQGLLMTAVIAVALPLPDIAWAQLSATSANAGSQVFAPAIRILNYACYTIGAFMGIGGIMKLKAHSENPTNTPMSHGIGRCSAGAAFLALPSVIGMLSSTSSSTLSGTAAFQTFTPGFN